MKSGLAKLVIPLLALAIGAAFAREAWRLYADERGADAAARSRLRAAESRRADALRQKARLESDAGRERLARERGWLRAGERPL